jgi:hypothetical protein
MQSSHAVGESKLNGHLGAAAIRSHGCVVSYISE